MSANQGVAVEYLAAGANRHAAVADWSRRGLLAFGAGVNVALWRPNLCPPVGIEALLSGHAETVKAVRFLPEADDDESCYLVTGSDDRTLIVWKSSSDHGRSFAPLQTCADHAGAVDCIAAARLAGDGGPRWVVATGAADATIRVWAFAADRLQPRQTIQTAPRFFPLALAVAALTDDGRALVLAAAGTRDAVQVLTADDAEPEALRFRLRATLAGHEGWVRSLSFARETDRAGGDLLLASASQDKYVRIWRMREGRELPAAAAAAPGPDPWGGKSPSNKAHRFESAGRHFSVTLEALLLGHEDWIYSAAWHAHAGGRLQLLSASADNTLAIWEADASSGIWVSRTRLGEISMEKGATTATGSAGGFWTGLWSPDGRSVACLGRTGSWRRWRHEAADDGWRPCVAVSGHTRAVRGIAWSRDGGYLLSTGADQTTRLHARWVVGPGGGGWHEMARPQIHGYDVNCIDSLGRSRFVSGADEKLMRVFGMSGAVAALLGRLAGFEGTDLGRMPDAASMPVLGLSNKAVDAVDDDGGGEDVDKDGEDDKDKDGEDGKDKDKDNKDADAALAPAVFESHLDTDRPPAEETLSRHTLWPELEKLYGHGYEMSCLAASHDGSVVASACKASSANHAVIRLFETQGWTELRPPLTAHALTATRLRFSADDALLLSVGRDRQWAVFERRAGEEATPAAPAYRLLQANARAHSRMLLDAAWAPPPLLFATAGRDRQVRLWAATGGGGDGAGGPRFAQAAAVTCASPVTAIDFLPRRVGGDAVLALGTEDGSLGVCLVSGDGARVTALAALDGLAFPRAVLQLAWRPRPPGGGGCAAHTLAAAGEDGSLRLFAFDEAYLRPGGR